MTSILLIIGAIGVTLIAAVMQKKSRGLRSITTGLLISYAMILGIALLGEAYFRCCFAQSENTITLATQNWLDRYWQTNSLGYRDRDWTPSDWADKTTIVITGDSFAAGWGIDDPANRFGDVLAALLGDRYAVINLGVYGTSTPEQLALLRDHPLSTPDVVIMQYFLNDINYTMLSMGVLPQAQSAPAWAQESYFGNFLYVRLISPLLDPGFNRDWWGENYAAYDNAVVWDAHRAEIDAYLDHVEAIGARLIVVIFPNMLDPVRSVAYVDRVAEAIAARGHDDILKLFDAAAAWDLNARIVSARDTHPSAAFHRYIGDALYEQFFTGIRSHHPPQEG